MQIDQPAAPDGVRALRSQAQIPAEAMLLARSGRAARSSLLIGLALALGHVSALAEPARTYAAATAKPATSQPATPQSARLTIPKPSAPSAAETEHMARLDKAIAPALARNLSKDDNERLGDAVRAVVRQDFAKAAEIKGQIGDATARRIVDWYRLRNGYGEAAQEFLPGPHPVSGAGRDALAQPRR